MKRHNNIASKRENRAHRMFTGLISSLLISILIMTVASASPLTQPKAGGWVGEQDNGYLGLVRQDAPAEVKALVAEINEKRGAGYRAIATKHGTRLSEVEKVSGQKALQKTLPGNYIREGNGPWHKK